MTLRHPVQLALTIGLLLALLVGAQMAYALDVTVDPPSQVYNPGGNSFNIYVAAGATCEVSGDGQIRNYLSSGGAIPVDVIGVQPGTTITVVCTLGADSGTAPFYIAPIDPPTPTAPNQPPVPVIRGAADGVITAIDADGDGRAVVMLDGAASYDPDGQVTTVRWQLYDDIIAEGPYDNASIRTISPTFNLGASEITLTVVDNQSASASRTVQVIVVAEEAAELTTTLTPTPLPGCLPDDLNEVFTLLYLAEEDPCALVSIVEAAGQAIPLSALSVPQVFAECAIDAALIPTWVDLMGRLSLLNPDLWTAVDAINASDPECAFARAIVSQQRLPDDMRGLSDQAGVELLALACLPAIDGARLEQLLTNIATLGPIDWRAESACATVQAASDLGAMDAIDSLLIDHITLLGCPNRRDLIAHWAQFQTYYGYSEEQIAQITCNPVEWPEGRGFVIEDYPPEQQTWLGEAIEMTTDRCALPNLRAFEVITTLLQYWPDLSAPYGATTLWYALLLSADPCQALEDYIKFGILPPAIAAAPAATPLPPVAISQPEPPPVPQPQPQQVEAAAAAVISAPVDEPACALGPEVICGPATAIYMAALADGAHEVRVLHRGAERVLDRRWFLDSLMMQTDAIITFPAIDRTGDRVIYLVTLGDTVWLYRTQLNDQNDATDSEPHQLLADEDLDDTGLEGYRLGRYAPVMHPDGSEALITIEDGDGLPSIYRLLLGQNPELDTEPISVRGGGLAPAYSVEGEETYITYVRVDAPGQTEGEIAIRATRSDVTAVIPQTIGQRCFSPAFDTSVEALAVFYLCRENGSVVFYRWSQSDNESRPATIDVQGIDLANINRIASGPATGYLAFDDGRRIYFGQFEVAEDGSATLGPRVLLEDAAIRLSALRWAAPSSED